MAVDQQTLSELLASEMKRAEYGERRGYADGYIAGLYAVYGATGQIPTHLWQFVESELRAWVERAREFGAHEAPPKPCDANEVRPAVELKENWYGRRDEDRVDGQGSIRSSNWWADTA